MLRRLFAERQILLRLNAGDIRRAPELKKPLGTVMRRVWPPRTMTRMVSYYDNSTNEKICTTHQFECEHGQILASGFPDPKFFYEATVTLVADPEHLDGDTCSPECSQDRAATEAARNGPLAQYRQRCQLCEAWLAQRRR
jgi:hypothetical protein